ncbi:interferon-induced 35 kDa protein-like [Megalops cyprinoides]|uniref:interferon-induced 35 kDa protein-like n=1 Tax=Megalops cyprinoides TaxID=118141 RepID=UPI001863BE13|nr:interferon-induced 35 kDa protein-like [Megalops cyprinoides]
MSSNEDFSLVTEDGQESQCSPLEMIRKETEKCKVTYDMLVEDQRELAKARDQRLHMAEEYQKRSLKLRRMLEEEEQNQTDLNHEKMKIAALQEEEGRLKAEILRTQEELRLLDQQTHEMRQRAEVFTAVPEKKVVFTGAVSEETGASRFKMKSRIVYPMEGGTALITFEEEAAAQRVLSRKHHEVHLGECNIKLEAQPVHILMPGQIEVDTCVCPKRILISNVPKEVDMSRVLDKLEIHFSKRRNCGGEVEDTSMLDDNVVITFVEDTLAEGLTDKQYHEVDVGGGKKHRVRVTPFLNAEITDLQMRMSVSPRTVLLTGIPAIMEHDELQDHLEIHFQKVRNGGGEVEAIAYNPLGHHTLAVFEEVQTSERQ